MQLNPTAKTPTDIRRLNRQTVLNLLRQHGTLSKSDLVRFSELTVTTIATILDELVTENLVEVASDLEPNRNGETTRGRPASFYRLNTRHWFSAGIQIASNSVTIVLLSFAGDVLDAATVEAPSHLPVDEVLNLASDQLNIMIGRTTTFEMALLGIGIALEGLVDMAAGLSLWMLLRTRWKDVPVAAHFEQLFNVPVLIDYRVYAAALAEATYGAARGVSDFAYLNVDTGVAVASVASNRIVRDSAGPAGLTGGLGHVLTTNGTRLCYCGKIGCLHIEITIQALLLQLKELISASHGSGIAEFWETHDIRLDNLIAAAQQGDPLALQLRHRFSQNLAIAVSGTAQLYSANMIIIGGMAVRFGGKEALDTARWAIQQLTIIQSHFGSTQVVASDISPDPATVGAASLIIQAVMDGQITMTV